MVVMVQMLAAVYVVLAGLFAQPDLPDYFVEAVVDNPAPYVGQQIIYTFRVYTAVSLPRTDFVPPDFEGFWRTEVGPATSYVQFVDGKLYTVTELDTALYPSYAGELVIESAVLTLPATVFRDAEVLRADPVPVMAQALPGDAPEAFDGAVGQIEMQATLDRQIGSVGDPFVLRLRVTGTGNIEQLTAPAVELPDGWRLYDNAVRYAAEQTETGLIGEKVFEWLLLPTAAGDFLLPSISLVYFDPAAATYRSIDTLAMALQVLPVEDTSDVVAAPIEVVDTVPAARPLPVIRAAAPVGMGMGLGLLLLWLTPPLLVVVAWWWVRRRSTAEQRRLAQRQMQAIDRAQVTLETARRATNQAASRLVIQAIHGYFNDKMLRESETYDISELEILMSRHGLSEPVRQQVQRCVEMAYSTRFAPVASGDTNGLVARTKRVLAEVDKEWSA